MKGEKGGKGEREREREERREGEREREFCCFGRITWFVGCLIDLYT